MSFDATYQDQKLKSVGTRPLRPDGVDKVTGRARYGADFNMPGQLVARVLRSPHAHARIVSIDTSQAEAVKGGKAVVTAADLPDLTNGNAGLYAILDNCMAREKALYDGHAVAAVAAIDAHAARAALKLIDVTYEVLPHVVDVDEAAKPCAPLLDETVFTAGIEPKPTQPSNVSNHAEFGHGDVEAGFAQADFVVERSYKTEQTHQGYIEPHACVANCNTDGTSDLWGCTQGHFVYRQHCAELLGIEASKLRVTSSEIGGGFGGKTHVWTEPVALALSRKAGRPVKLVMSREEVFRASGPTSATSIDVKIGATKDGKITAGTATLRYTGGPYPGDWAEIGAMTAFACYDLENVKTVGVEVIVNRPKVAAYRAPSAPMAAFAVESAVDELADQIGINPVDFRIKNAAQEGSRSSYGPVYGPIGIGPTLDAAKTHAHMSAPLGENQGRGMACGFWFNFGGQTCTDMNISADGTVTIAVGTVDVGGSRASLSLIAAEELGIDYKDVKAVIADTSTLGYNDMTDGSRGTFSSSMATISAARNAIAVMRNRAALMWDIPVEDSLLYEFNETSLFDSNGYAGFDIYEDGNKASAGLSATMRWKNGVNITALGGRRWRSEASSFLNEASNLDGTVSDWVGGLSADFGDPLKVETRVRLDDNDLNLNRIDARITSSIGRIRGTARYFRIDESISAIGEPDEGVDLSADFRLTDTYSFINERQRDISDGRDLRHTFGIAYEDDCSRFEIAFQRSEAVDRSIGPNDSIRFRFALKTLGEFGSRDTD